MNVLGVETGGEVAGVALANADGVVAELEIEHRMQLSRCLVPRIEELLRAAGMQIGEIEGVAVSVGPGSFTGLRIGVTAAKVLAYARGIPVAAVGSLEALAAQHPVPPGTLLCAVLPASPEHLYAGLYEWEGGRPVARAAARLLPVRELAESLRAANTEVLIAGQPGPHLDRLLDAAGGRGTLAADPACPRAATVALLGRRDLLEGVSFPVHALAPQYLRPSTPEARMAASLEAAACS